MFKSTATSQQEIDQRFKPYKGNVQMVLGMLVARLKNVSNPIRAMFKCR